MLEANIDAIVGPSHHFGGLGVGNVASQSHASTPSSPKKAALEGLHKAEIVAGLGVPQFLFLPPMRPRLDLLSRLGFVGSEQEQLEQAAERMPRAVSACFSSAFMWAANSSTVSPSIDSSDGQLHFTPANLISSWHRAFEAEERQRDLQEIFGNVDRANVHQALPNIAPLRDEGAANHMRLCDASGEKALHVFVHGEAEASDVRPGRFLARHTMECSQGLAQLGRLQTEQTFFLHQHPQAISAGVFHNDVIATSHQNVLIHHELAFWEAESELERLEQCFVSYAGQPLCRIEVSQAVLPMEEAVASYFFNSQLLSPSQFAGSGGRQDLRQVAGAVGAAESLDDFGYDASAMVLVCPGQCQEIDSARQLIERLIADPGNPISAVHYVSLAESMANGGGPACLRLRVSLREEELAQVDSRFRVTPDSLAKLRSAIERDYPDRLVASDFLNADCRQHIRRATDRLRSALLG